jgi:hypothetical protein
MIYSKEVNGKTVAIIFMLAFSLMLLMPATSPAAEVHNGHLYSIDPEYERTVSRVMISTDMETPLALQMDTIKKLPRYTEVLVLLPSHRLEDIKQEIGDVSRRRKISLIPFDTHVLRNVHTYLLLHKSGHVASTMYKELEMPKGSVWAQDLFEVARADDGKHVIVAPDVIDAFFLPQGHAMNEKLSDNAYITDLADKGGFRVMKTPLTFKGGNLLTDRLNGRNIAFLGGDVISDTMAVLRATAGYNKYSTSDIYRMIRDFLNVDEVVVIGEGGRQPNQLYHLDQAMIFLREGVVGVTRVLYKDYGLRNNQEIMKVEQFLSETRRKLAGLGYRIVNIHTTAEDVLNFRYYANGLVYTNTRTGKREFLMPDYPHARSPFIENIIRRNTVAFEVEGYTVTPVPTDVNRHEGGLHCIVNIIS